MKLVIFAPTLKNICRPFGCSNVKSYLDEYSLYSAGVLSKACR